MRVARLVLVMGEVIFFSLACRPVLMAMNSIRLLREAMRSLRSVGGGERYGGDQNAEGIKQGHGNRHV